jgi:hypothetical protein
MHATTSAADGFAKANPTRHPEGAIPRLVSAEVACDEAGVAPYGMPSRTFSAENGRRTAIDGAEVNNLLMS